MTLERVTVRSMASLLLVSIPVVISAEGLQVFFNGLALRPKWLNVIDLQMLSAAANFTCVSVFILTALITV